MTTFLEIGFGKTVEGSDADACLKFAKMFDLAQLQSTERLGDIFWKAKRFFQLGSRERSISKAIAYLDTFALNCIKEHRRGHINLDAADLLSRALLEAEDRKEYVSDNYLRDLLINFLIAGRDTTACLLSWTIYCLHSHPDIEAQVVQEMKQAQAEGGEAFSILAKLELTEAVLLEVLRLYPSVPVDAKYAIENDVLPDGTFIEKHTTVSYRPYLFGRSPLLWGPDAGLFKPTRWLDGGSHSQYKFISFNAGPRFCFGNPV